MRDALKCALDVSDLANKFIQSNAIWDKGIEKVSLDNKLFVLVNVIRLIGLLLEPFIATFSAKLYFVLNVKRTVEDETLIGKLNEQKSSKCLLKFLSSGHQINVSVPLVTPSFLKSFVD